MVKNGWYAKLAMLEALLIGRHLVDCLDFIILRDDDHVSKQQAVRTLQQSAYFCLGLIKTAVDTNLTVITLKQLLSIKANVGL